MSNWIESTSAFIVLRRHAVLLLLAIVTLIAALQIPRLQADFTPSDLFARVPEEEALAQRFRTTFGNTDNVLLLIVQSENLLDSSNLQYVHDLARSMQEQPFAARVNALTLLPLPVQNQTEPANPDDTPIAVAAWQAVAQPLQASAALFAEAIGKPVPEPTEPPDALYRLARGEAITTVQPAVPGEQITPEDIQNLRNAIERSGLLRGQLISDDLRTTLVAVQFSGDYDRAAEIEQAVGDAREVVAALQTPDGISVSWAGLPYLRTALVERMRRDQSILMPASIGVCVLILLMAFRWLPGIILPLIAVGMTAVQLVGGMALVGEKFNILNNIIPLLIIIIGISDSIHIISRYGEELRLGKEPGRAAKDTLATMAAACFMTSFTTSLGFATLVVSHTALLQRFGLVAAVGVLLAYIITVTFIPAALTFIKQPPAGSGAATEGRFEDIVEAITRKVMAHPGPSLILSTLLLGGAAWLSTGVKVDAAVLDQFHRSDDIWISTHLLEEELSGFRPLEVYLIADSPDRFTDPQVLAAFDNLTEWAEQQEGVLRTGSFLDYVREARALVTDDFTPDARLEPFASSDEVARYLSVFGDNPTSPIRSWLSADGKEARLNLAILDFGARRTIALAEQLQAEIRNQFGNLSGIEVRLTGDAYTSSLGLQSVIGDLASSLGLATILIFLFMTLLFRNLKLGLISIPPNVLPLVFTLAAMVLLDIPLNAATVIIFSISIGLAVDGTIHVLARLQEERRAGHNIENAMARSARGAGKAIVLTCFSLMLGFSVMLLSAFVPVQRFGLLIGISMFSCLVATLLVLPALIRVAWHRE